MPARVLPRWNPEDGAFWEREGRSVASRNLLISIPALTLAFAVWMLWSVVVVNLPNVGFALSTGELFWLAALPGLCGATLRVFYAFMVPIFGGRRWTAISTALLLLPTVGIGFAVTDPATGYPTLALLALLCGLGGGNFASSMANVNLLFPRAQRGTALGLNAGLGNLGVSLMQFVVPLVISVGVFGWLGGEPQVVTRGAEVRQLWLQNAGLIWVPLIAILAVAAWFGMNDLAGARTSFADQAALLKRKHCRIVCWFYLGTFGSFIGYSAAFPLLVQSQFPQVNALSYAWLGPLVGALVRPFGGWLSDRFGSARVTFWNFVVMASGALGALYFLPAGQWSGNFYGLLAMFMLLFSAAGIGNGSIFRMILVVFVDRRRRAAAGGGRGGERRAARGADAEATAVLGFCSAIGAYGGFFVPASHGIAISVFGTPVYALCLFIAYYASCIAMTWWFCTRRSAAMPC